MSGRGSILSQRVDAAIADERRLAMRALLMHPLITAAGNRESLALIRRHGEWLVSWFSHHAGWHLHIDTEVARLGKTPAEVSSTHPARDKHGQPFTRRRYVLLCLALASLERAGRQITLRRLAEDLQGQIAGDPVLVAGGMTLQAEERDHRADLVAIGRYLADLQVIARVHGDEESFLAASGDCLYAVRRSILARLLAARIGPSLVVAGGPAERLLALQQEFHGEGDDARNRMIRQRLVRQLLERPVVYDADLDQEERQYLRSQRPHLMRTITEATGLVAEVRAEGIALVDPERELTDNPLPEEGTDGHAALLLAAWLVERIREQPGAPVPIAAVESYVAACAAEQTRWRRDARTTEGALELSRQLIESLVALDLIRRTGNMIIPLAALARFGIADEATSDAASQPAIAPTGLGAPT